MVVCDGSLLKRKRKMSCLDIEKIKRKKKKSKVVGLRKIFVKKKKKSKEEDKGLTAYRPMICSGAMVRSSIKRRTSLVPA